MFVSGFCELLFHVGLCVLLLSFAFLPCLKFISYLFYEFLGICFCLLVKLLLVTGGTGISYKGMLYKLDSFSGMQSIIDIHNRTSIHVIHLSTERDGWPEILSNDTSRITDNQRLLLETS
jgi:hypothetical protein